VGNSAEAVGSIGTGRGAVARRDSLHNTADRSVHRRAADSPARVRNTARFLVMTTAVRYPETETVDVAEAPPRETEDSPAVEGGT